MPRRRRGRNKSHTRRNQPSPAAPSQPTPAEAAGRGRGETSAPFSTPAPVPSHPPPLPPAPVASSSSSTPPPVASSSAAPCSASPSTSKEALSSEFEQKLTLQTPAPSSSTDLRIPDRPGYGTDGKKIKVRANHFPVKVDECDLHHYHVSMTPEVESKRFSRVVMNKLIQMYQETFLGNRIPTYDGRGRLYMARKLPFQSRDFEVKFLDNDEQASSSGSARKKREQKFMVTIRYVSKNDLYHLEQFLKGLPLDLPQETIQALDIVLRVSPSEKYNVVGRAFFSPDLGGKGPLGSGTEYWGGYYQSLRPAQMGLSLNIDVSAKAFYESVPVTEFIKKHFNFNLSDPLSDQDRVKVKKALRGVMVKCTHAECISYKVDEVSKEPLEKLTFPLDDKQKGIVQYFREKYNIVLKHLNLPALQAASDKKLIYLPMELCQIIAGQRYIRRLNEHQESALSSANCQCPHERGKKIRKIVKQNNFNNDQLVHKFGIHVMEELALVDARVLPPPKLKYHGRGKESIVEPRMGQWDMKDKKMFNGGEVMYWTCLNFSTRVNEVLPYQFCSDLVDMCISKGMLFNKEPLLDITSAQPDRSNR